MSAKQENEEVLRQMGGQAEDDSWYKNPDLEGIGDDHLAERAAKLRSFSYLPPEDQVLLDAIEAEQAKRAASPKLSEDAE
jgi:hypothetical protein